MCNQIELTVRQCIQDGTILVYAQYVNFYETVGRAVPCYDIRGGLQVKMPFNEQTAASSKGPFDPVDNPEPVVVAIERVGDWLAKQIPYKQTRRWAERITTECMEDVLSNRKRRLGFLVHTVESAEAKV
jgi:hypothetical protein